MRRTRFAAVVSTGLILAVSAAVPTAAVAVPGAEPVPTSGAQPGTTPDSTATVRLITGDRVRVTTTADGRHTASVEPGAGRERVVFHTSDADGRLTVLPSDADPLVRSGRLDRRLFDVTALVEQRYDEEHRASLPLIVAGSGGAAADRLTALAAPGAPTHDLGSIGAHSLTVPDAKLAAFWQQIVPAGTDTGKTGTAAAGTGPADTAKAAAVPKIWLDGRVRAAADSMDQIGAPPLWKAGYEGTGVKVAVLDTGVDQTHPDLKDRVAKAEDFTESPTGTGDHFGHGTHVASIVGGTGAASGGARKGVAKAANLLVGKVLGDDGYGYDSQVIAGMQWAADQGAKVVNMSLGADDESDGTDPMSLALNEISEASGTLFVVAAGNNGENGQQTVGIPGVADDALTVGAVDGKDALANFSSRGPRYGDGAVKPDVTAPGVDIVAARASGTTLGDPVDPYYVSLSGTSMATPHVAGAAALLAQRHPDWTARQLKDALISTAHTVDGQAVTDQGGGRIDVSAAALGTLTATGTVFLGDIHATDPKATYPVTYTNTSAAPVTLTLGLALRTSGGRGVNAGAVRIGDGSAAATKVTVPAHGTARADLTLDPAKVTYGSYYGYLTATPAGGTAGAAVHTTLGLVAHGPLHTLTVTAYDAHGAPAHPTISIWGASGLLYPSGDSKGTSASDLEEGTYQVRASFQEMTDDGMEERLVVLPEVRLTKDTAVTVDARRTTQVEIRTPRPAEQSGIPYYQTYRQIEGRGLTESEEFFTGILSKLYVSPTAKVTDGDFEFSSRWQLAAPQLTTEAPGTGLRLKSYYTSYSPLFDSKGVNLTAVDAGSLEAPDFSGARGKLAVVRNESGEGERELAAAAATAGVRGLMIVHFSDFGWTRWYPTGERNAVPTIRIGKAAGDALLARLAKKPVKTVTVRIGGTAVSPYLYDVFQTSAQQIPQRVVHTVTAANSAVIRTTYAENGGAPWAAEQRFAWRPYQNFAWEATRNVPTGVTRTEYVSANGTWWMHRVNQETTFDIDQPLLAGMVDTTTTYRAGKQPDQAWQQAVVRPSIPRGTRNPSVRNGDVLDLRIPEFTDSGAGHWARAAVGGDFGGFGTAAGTSPASGTRTASGTSGAQDAPVEGDSAKATLFRDGRRIAAADSPWADLEVPAGTADYRLDVATSRVSPEWRYATDTSTSWWFRSGTAARPTLLPLLQVDYAVPVDAWNAVRKGSSHTVGLTVRAQDGAAVPTGVKVEVQASYDDGRTWTGARVDGRGHNTFDARLTKSARSRGDAYVTLRVTARDAAGDQVRQTVRRAYLWRG
ncbi:S8 family serine peptidase [Streptomyces sp. NPDC008317]|uniref:S8 family serine peptidase n=1 Tax=Streptomyces sp. NPDC008317 TaxID=3364827 RepID=UPI0036F14765